ncbi:hypothetical protein [Nostoc sp. CALU 1950]|uniref:hypothetical protein n=1 Tax=Nostoc sp. CALU 1950 TaxID=3104321 RepID=UPI003EBB1FA5
MYLKEALPQFKLLEAEPRLLILAIFLGITEKLFVLVFACVKAPATAIFTPK